MCQKRLRLDKSVKKESQNKSSIDSSFCKQINLIFVLYFYESCFQRENINRVLAGNSNCVGIHLRFATGRSLIDRFPRIKVKAPSLKMLSFGECQIVKITDFDRLSDSGIMEIHVDRIGYISEHWFLIFPKSNFELQKDQKLNQVINVFSSYHQVR